MADVNVNLFSNTPKFCQKNLSTSEILTANHGASGTATLPALGFQWIDKDSQVWYTVTDADTSVPYAHRYELTPNDELVTGSVSPNTPYLIGTAKFVGGCQGPTITNS